MRDGGVVGIDARAKAQLRSLFPELGPWTAAALWHGVTPEPAAVPQTPIEAEVGVLVEQRLAGLALRFIRDTGASIGHHRDDLQAASFAWTMQTTQAATSGAAALARLREAGVEGAVSKGPGIAAAYPALDCRPYSDLDVVVAPRHFGRSVRLLESLGWSEDTYNLQPWGYFRRVCREGVNLRLEESGSVDIHHRFPPWIWSSALPFAMVAGRTVDVVAAGETLPCLAPADNLLVAALHVVSDRNAPGRSLLVWRDLVQLASVVQVDEAVRVARGAALAGWLRAVLLAVPEPVRPTELIAALPDDPVPHGRRLASVLSARTERLGVLASQFLRLPLANGIAYVAGMLLPPPGFLRRKYPDTPHLYRRWWVHGRHSAPR